MASPIEAFQNAVSSANLLSMSRAARLLNASNEELGANWAHVVSQMITSGDELGALESARKLVEASPDHAQSYSWLATAQSMMGDHYAAYRTIFKQLPRFPEDGPLRTRLGREALNLGWREIARGAFSDALRLNPHDAVAWEGLAEIHTFKQGDDILGQLEELRLTWPEDTPSQSKGVLSYTLAKAYNDIGEYDAAARRVSEAAAFIREGVEFDVNHHEAGARQLIATYDDRFVSANDDIGVIDSRPVFIIAPPCAGAQWLADVLSVDEETTSLSRNNAMFWMSSSALGNHDSDALLRELALGESESVFNAVAHTYLEYLSERTGYGRWKRVIDPSSLNEMSGGTIGLCMPTSKMIHIRRDSRDLAWAIYSRRFRRGRYWTYHPDDIVRVLFCYERLIGRWRDLYPDQVMQIRYEDLVQDPMGQVAQIAKFLGIDPEVTASEAWLRAGVLRTDPPEIWTRAGTHFEPVQSALIRAGLLEG